MKLLRERKFSFLTLAVFLLLLILMVLQGDDIYKHLKAYCRQFEIKTRASGPMESGDPKLLQYIRENFLEKPAIMPYNISDMKHRHMKQLTWGFINSFIVKLFKDEPPGFFIEAGALDGVTLSNTLWLEKKRNWKGLLIEPSLANYKSLKAANRKAWTSHSCISTVHYPKTTTFVEFNPVSKGENYDAQAWLMRSQSFKDAGEAGFNPGDQPAFRTIQCFPLASYIMALNVTTVDFISLDIQGGEWDVLKMWPWDKLHIRSLVIEFTIKDLSQKFVDFMIEMGYALLGRSEEPDYDYFFVSMKDPLYFRFMKLQKKPVKKLGMLPSVNYTQNLQAR